MTDLTEPRLSPDNHPSADRELSRDPRELNFDESPGDSEADAALRADIRRLGALLGQTLVRQEGQALLDLVEQVRAQVRTDPTAAAARLAAMDVLTGTKLARAFSTYFHLANITEQAHRARELCRRRAPRRRLAGRRRARRSARRACRPTTSPRPPGGWRSGRSSPRTRPRRRAARSCPSCAPSPTSSTPRPMRGRALRRSAGSAPSRHRPRRADRPAVADRRAAGRPAGPDRRGPQRHLLPARPVRRRGAAGAHRSDRDAAHAGRADAAERPPAHLRHAGSAATGTATRT